MPKLPNIFKIKGLGSFTRKELEELLLRRTSHFKANPELLPKIFGELDKPSNVIPMDMSERIIRGRIPRTTDLPYDARPFSPEGPAGSLTVPKELFTTNSGEMPRVGDQISTRPVNIRGKETWGITQQMEDELSGVFETDRVRDLVRLNFGTKGLKLFDSAFREAKVKEGLPDEVAARFAYQAIRYIPAGLLATQLPKFEALEKLFGSEE